jgi:HEAT repeat protein
MKTEEALTFLRRFQPLPPTKELSEDLINQYDAIRKHFKNFPDDRCVPLLLNSFGLGDGFGVYQLVEDTILNQNESVVIPEIIRALRNESGSVRYWNAQIASNFRRSELVPPLLELIRGGNIDERLAAVFALEAIGTSAALAALKESMKFEIEDYVKGEIQKVLSAG